VRYLGQALVAAGLLLATFGVIVVASLSELCENDCERDTAEGFVDALVALGLGTAPGAMVAGIGLLIVRSHRRDSDAHGLSSHAIAWVLTAVAAVTFAGVAHSMSTTDHGPPAPPPKPRSVKQQIADEASYRARDAAAHPIPARALQRAARRVRTALRDRHPEARVRCKHSDSWGVSCRIVVTDNLGKRVEVAQLGDYDPEAGSVVFDPPLTQLKDW
jgi:hypothetical protein